MQQKTSRLLYEYWNTVRNGRNAPQRFEIEPAKIAALLPETFIAECAGMSGYRLRLAGTRICEQFGQELRGRDLLEWWTAHDREALETILHNVVTECAAGVVRFTARRDVASAARFEMVLMPLISTGRSVNRILGGIAAIDPPFWLGTAVLGSFRVDALDLLWPDGKPALLQSAAEPAAANTASAPAGDPRRRFRVHEGGLSKNPPAS